MRGWIGSWRFALRMARRQVLRSKARNALIVAMLALPVFGTVGVTTLVHSATDLSASEQLVRHVGEFDAFVQASQGIPIEQSADGQQWESQSGTAKVGADVLRILYDSASIKPAPSGYFANLAQLDDPTVDSLLQRAAQTADTHDRGELYEQAQKDILASATVLPLYDQQNHFLVSTKVHDVRTTAVSTPWFGSAWIDR